MKDPRERLRDIGDARIEIGEVLASPVSETEADVPKGRRPRSHALTALGATAATALIMWLFAGTATNPAVAPVRRATILLPEGQSQRRLLKAPIAISPDGSLLAYAAEDAEGSGLFLRSLDSFETRKLSGTEGADAPFFSPDGEWVGFFAAGKLKKVSVERGAALTITKAPDGIGASWAADDTIVFSPAHGAGLFRVSADGGVPEQLTKPDFAEAGYAHAWPDHLPGDREILFTLSGTGGGAAVLNLETRDWHIVQQNSDGAQYLSTGHIISSNSTIGGGLLAAPFDGTSPAVTGPTVSMVDAVRFLAEFAWPYAAVSQTGTLVYVREPAAPATLAWMDREGTMTPIRSHVGLTAPRLSPDGERVVFNDDDGSIWILDVPRATIDVLVSVDTFGGSWGPTWNPDGRRVTFSSRRTGDWELYEITVSDRGQPEALLVRENDQYARSWSSDGRLLVYLELHPVTVADLWVLPVGEEPVPVLTTEFSEDSPAFSPNGRFIAYVSNQSGQHRVYVLSYPEREVFPISTAGGEEPVWSRDGQELFFRDGNALLSVAITNHPEFQASTPTKLHEQPFDRSGYGFGTYYDVSPDGEHFLVVADRSTTEFQVVFNWFQELERLAPTK